jgi:NRPS condensation-like uncharacterized protein
MTSIEAFHLYSSTDQWPNVITSRHRFSGPFHESNARAAWEHCVSRQKFAAWKFKSNQRRPGWDTSDELRTPFSELAESSFHLQSLSQLPESELDLNLEGFSERGIANLDLEEGAFGIWCVTSPKETLIIFAVHHALADGPGGIVFIRDWFTAYHNLCHGRDVSVGLGKLDWQRWKNRNRLGLLTLSFLKRLPFQWIAVFGATKFLFRKFKTLHGSTPKPVPTIHASPGVAGRWVDANTVERLNDHAQRVGISSNSLLMTMAFRAIDKVAESDGQRWLRIVLPINIREYADRRLPVANRASLVQIDRTKEQVADLSSGAFSIDREVRIIIGCKLDRAFLIAIRLLSASHWLMKRSALKAMSRGTIVFTNLSEPFRKCRACDFSNVGQMKLQDFDMCGPVRSGTPINFAWQLHRASDADDKRPRGRITVHFDRNVISPSDANGFLDAFEKEFDSLA